MAGYDIGELVAEVWVDTSTMSKGIEDSKKILQGFESKIVDVSKGVDKQTQMMGKAFKTMSNGMELHLDAMIELTQAVKDGFRQMGAQMNSSSEQGRKNMQSLSTGFRTVREGIDHCVQSVGRVNKGLAQTGQQAPAINRVTNSIQSLARSIATASRNSEGLFEKLSHLSLYGYILYQDLRFMGEAIGGLFAPGMKFAVQMENAQVGMAAIMTSSFKTAEGANVKFNDAMVVSTQVMKNMQAEALRTTATLEELLTTFQAILGPGVAKGMNMQEIQDIAVLSVNAVKAMGLRKDQLVQEIRSILTDNITARSSTVATALGITNKDVEEAKNNVGGVAEFLKQRFQGFKLMADETEGTFLALWSNIEDGLQQTQSKAFEPFFKKIKDELKQVQSLFFNVTKYQQDVFDANGKKTHSAGDIQTASLNPKTVALFREMATIVSTIYDDIKKWGTELLNDYDRVQYMKDLFTGVSQLAKSIYENISFIGKALLIAWTFSGGWMKIIIGVAAIMDKLPGLLNFIADHIETITVLLTGWLIISRAIALVYSLTLAIGALEGALVSMKIVSDGAFLAMGRSILALMTPIGIVAGGLILITSLAAAAANAIHGGTVGKGNKQVDLAYASGRRPEDFGNMSSSESEKPRLAGMTSDQANQLLAESKNQAEIDRVMKDAEKWMSKWDKEGDEKGSKTAAKAAAAEANKSALKSIEEAMSSAVEKIKTYQKELQYQYEEGTIAIEDYYNAMKKSEEAIVALEIAALNKKIELASKNSDIIELQKQIAKKKEELARTETDLERKRLKDYKQFTTEMDTLHSDYVSKSGSVDTGDRMESVFNKYKKELLDMANFSKGFKDIIASDSSSNADKERAGEYLALTQQRGEELKKIIAIELAEVGVDQQLLQIKKDEVKLIPLQNEYEWDYNNGLMTELGYKQKLFDLDRQRLTELMPYYEKQYAYLKYQADVTGDPKYLEQMEALREKVKGLQHDMTALNTAIRSTFRDGLQEALVGMMNGTKTFKDGLKDMISSLQDIYFKEIANKMTNNISKYLLKKDNTKSPEDAFSNPETKKRIETMVSEMKKSGNELFKVFQDSATSVKSEIDKNLLPQLNALAKKISEITGVPLGTGDGGGTGEDGKPKKTTGLAALSDFVSPGEKDKDIVEKEKHVVATKANIEKFKQSTSQIATFTGALAVATGSAGLMKFATTLEMINSLIGSLQGVGMFGGVPKAEGGFVSGSGTSTSDSIPARLSDGEFVVRASSVKKYGTKFLESVNKGRLPQARYAEGGLVSAASALAKQGGTGAGSQQAPVINFTINPAFHSTDPATNQKMFETQMPYMKAKMMEMMRSDPSFRNAMKGAIR